jgi:sialidase-1
MKVKRINHAFIQKTDIFIGRSEGYYTYRIPTIVVSDKGTILAFAEARTTENDWAARAIVMKRSFDYGKTWEPMKILVSDERKAIQNPVAIVERNSNIIHFLYCFHYKRAFYMQSNDEGNTFSEPVEITQTFNIFKAEYPFKILATGPGHGIQLDNGRLIVPIWLSPRRIHRPSVTSVIYSDDSGKNWYPGEIIKEPLVNPSETQAIQLANGNVLLNIRNETEISRRAIAISKNGVKNWTEPVFDHALVEPTCFASIVRFTKSEKEDKNRIIFSNPDSLEGEPLAFNIRPRKNLSIKLSYDECKTWSVSKVLEPGMSGYSDLAIGKDYTIYCFYERGIQTKSYFDTASLCVARFDLEWLTDGRDTII